MQPDTWSRLAEYVKESKERLVEEVRELLRIPSISGTGEGIEETANYIGDWLKERLGVEPAFLRYGRHPIIYGKLDVGAGRTVVLYNMYDVQPPDPLDAWEVPPFEARIVGDRIVARGAYNTKGALMSCLLGVEAFLRVGSEPPVNLVFVLEGEEELGSPSMPKFVEDKGSELKGSYMVYFAIPSERVPGKPIIVLGHKGIVFVELKCRVAKYDAHSSLGRGLINPVAALARVISHLLDPAEGPRLPWLEEKTVAPTSEDLRYLRDLVEACPREEVLKVYGVEKARLGGLDWYVAVYFKPSVNVDGIISGYMGPGTKTITPAEARARLDFRLVPNIEPEDVVEGLESVVERLGLRDLVEIEVHDSYPWSKTDPKAPPVQDAKRAYEKIGTRPYVVPMTPGSAPSYLFTRVLGLPMVQTGPGHGGRAHAPNEYITVDTVPKMVLYTAALLLEASRS